jgi:hypothetical protein
MNKPNTQYKGTWIPKKVMEMVWEGELTPTEAILLGTIHSLSKNDEGCTAKRETLAGYVNISTDHVKKLISKFRKMGLVVDLEFNGRTQAIKAYWDNEPMPRQQWRRCHGSSGVDATAEKTSSSPSSMRGGVDATAHQATNKNNNISNRKNLGEEENNTEPLKESSTNLPSQPSAEYGEWLNQKKLNQVKKDLKKKHGGTIPSWVNIDEEVEKLPDPPPLTTEITDEYKKFCQEISEDRKAIHPPSQQGQRMWNRIRESYNPSQIKAACRIAYKTDEFWRDNFIPELFFRETSGSSGQPVDHIGKFLNKRAGDDHIITQIKQDWKHEQENSQS